MFARKGAGIVQTDSQAKDKYARQIQKLNEHQRMKMDIQQLKTDMDNLKIALLELTVSVAAGKCDGYA